MAKPKVDKAKPDKANPDIETVAVFERQDGVGTDIAIDPDGGLYLNGKLVATGITLTTQQGIGAWIVVIAAGLGGILALLEIIWWFKAW